MGEYFVFAYVIISIVALIQNQFNWNKSFKIQSRDIEQVDQTTIIECKDAWWDLGYRKGLEDGYAEIQSGVSSTRRGEPYSIEPGSSK